MKIKRVFLSIAIIIILGFAVYGNSLNGKFLLDDLKLIEGNIYIKSWTNLQKIFTEDIGAGAGCEYNFYRPLQMFTYMVDYSIWKLNVLGYHLTNTILHILVALCILWLVNILFEDRFLSFFTSIFFLVHPVHTEAVAYISGRTDLLASLFMLLCIILYIKQVYILMLLCYVASLLSRESSLILPILILLYHYAFKEKLKIKKYLPILGVTLIYIILRLTVLKFPLPSMPHPDLYQRIIGCFVAIANYLRILLLPFNLHMVYEYKSFNLLNPFVIPGAAILFSLLIYAFRKRGSDKLIFFSAYWFFIALLPVSDIYPINAYMAEHWLYLPSIGFFLILARGLSLIYQSKGFRAVALTLVISLLAFYSFLTIRQNDYWKEPIDFYKRTLKYSPHSSRLYNNLGTTYAKLGDYVEAIAALKKALEINPNDAYAYYNLGRAHRIMGEYEEAIASFKKALKITPKNANLYFNLGMAYAKIGEYEEAITSFKKTLEITPNFAEGYNNLGNIYCEMGKNKEAITFYEMAIKINPNLAIAHYNLAIAYYYEKQYDLAIKYCDKAIELGYKVDLQLLESLKAYRR